MITGKQLEPIIPFNGVFYKGCFFNSLFSMLSFFGTDELPLLFNDMIVYGHNEDSGLIRAEYVGFRETHAVLLEQGIRMNVSEVVEDVVVAIQQSIQAGRPVIVSVDSYYIPGRKDTYQKMHWPHSLLVFGFDNPNRMFDIVEHRDRDSLTYDKRSITFDDLAKAFEGYIESRKRAKSGELTTWPDIEAPLYAEFEEEALAAAGTASQLAAVAADFEQRMSDFKHRMLQSVETLNPFIEKIRRWIDDETAVKNGAEALLYEITGIINAKQVEKYRLMRMSGRYPQLLHHLQAVTVDWNIIRTIIGKLVFSGIYKREDLARLIPHLERIATLEASIADRW